MEYVLFVDESNWDSEDHKKSFQIAGFWAPATRGIRDAVLSQFTPLATDHFTRCCNASGLPKEHIEHAFHAMNQPMVGSFMERFFDTLPADWNPVRIINSFDIDFRDPDTNYVMTLAQLLDHVESQILETGAPGPVHLVAARVMKFNKQHGKYLDEIPISAYRDRIQLEKLIARHRRRGTATARETPSADGQIWIESANTESPLKICDWISYCSHSSFSPMKVACKPAVEMARERMDTVQFDPAGYDSHLGELIQSGRLGEALLILSRLKTRHELRESVLASLADRPAHQRDPQLHTLVTYWEKLVVSDRDPRALRALRRHHVKVLKPLLDLLITANRNQESTLDPVFFAYHSLCLEACNHQGDLVNATHHRQELMERSPSLAGRWDQVNLLLEGHIRIAVHDTDRFETQQAIDSMRSFEKFVDGVGSLFHAELPDIFPEVVRSDIRGKLLGTCLQAVADRILVDPDSAEDARSLNEMAMVEFSDPFDVARQQQYRSQIECLSGQATDALDWLGRSLDLEAGASQREIATRLEEFAAEDSRGDSLAVGFGLLHWSRIGSRSAIMTPGSPLPEGFLKAFKATTHLRKHRWVTGNESLIYPAHGIRRYLASIEAATGGESAALQILRGCRYLATFNDRDHGLPLFDLFLTTAQCECAVLFARTENSSQAHSLLTSSKPEFRGAIPRLKRLATEIETVQELEAMREYVEEFLQHATTVANNIESPRASELDALALHSQRFSH